MPNQYACISRDATGQIVRATVSANSLHEAINWVRQNGQTPISVSLKRNMALSLDFLRSERRLDLKTLFLFCRQIALVLRSGLTLARAIEIQKRQVSNKHLNKLLDTIHTELSAGRSFSSALSVCGKAFSNILISLVYVGEQSGKLDTILERYSDILEKQQEIRSEIKGAMIYPAIIVLVGIGVMTGLLIFVIPKFGEVLSSTDVRLPTLTLMVLSLSDMLRQHYVIVLSVLVVGIAALWRFARSSYGSEVMAKLKLRLPIIGSLARREVVARMTGTLGLLLESGVPLLRAFELVGPVVANAAIEAEVKKCAQGLSRGEGFARHLSHLKSMPDMAKQLILVGEETGTLDHVLGQISRFYQAETEKQAKGLTKAIEPLLLLFIGSGVGVMAAGLITGIMKVMQSLQGGH